jgi:hypothetical protein
VLAVGVFSVGLSACGSGSSKGTNSSTGTNGSSSVVKKEASGLAKDVELTVVNKTNVGSLYVSVCDATPDSTTAGACPEFNNYVLDVGKSAYRTHEAVAGEVRDGAGNGFKFYAKNPDVGEPYIQIWKIGNQPDIYDKVRLSEGETVKCPMIATSGQPAPENCPRGFGRVVELSRSADTSVKVLKITVLA